MNSHKIRKEFKTVANLKKNADAFEILFGQAPVIKVTGAFLTHGILAHLNDHEIISFTSKSFMVQEKYGNKEAFTIQRGFEDAIEKQIFTLE